MGENSLRFGAGHIPDTFLSLFSNYLFLVWLYPR